MRSADPYEFLRSIKLAFYLALDAALVPFSLFVAHALRYGSVTDMLSRDDAGIILIAMTLAGATVSVGLRMNTIGLRVIVVQSVLRLVAGAVLLGLLVLALSYRFAAPGPRTIPVIFVAVYFFSAIGLRLAIIAVLGALDSRANPATRVAIYGAGSAGLQLAVALHAAGPVKPRFFIDDNPALQGLMLAGLPVYPFARIDDMARRHGVRRILLAMPGVARKRQAHLTHILTERGYEVRVLPSYTDIMAGSGAAMLPAASLADATTALALRPVDPEQVFGRSTVTLDLPEVAKAYAGRVVLVTGAGGRVGAELCRQLLHCNPARLVLLDQNENALLKLAQDLRPLAETARVTLSARLGDVTHRAGIVTTLRDEGIEVVFHAAVYRNAPLVETNELESTRNNVVGTQVLAEAAEAAGVERFVLVSGARLSNMDNIVNATRSMAELVIQDLAMRAQTTRYCVVRLAHTPTEKGGLLPLLQRQIQSGGPVTLPHPDATRIFVSLTDSARLALVAAAMARGGEVMLLNPGKPRNLLALTQDLIRCSGRQVKNPITGEGDIEIRFTGLRPGEMLTDQAALNSAAPGATATAHPDVMLVEAARLSQIEIAAMMREIALVIEAGDPVRLRALIAARVGGLTKTTIPAVSA